MVTLHDSSHVVHSEYDVVYLHDHEVQKEDMRRLYENAKRDQWNAAHLHRVGQAGGPGAGLRRR